VNIKRWNYLQGESLASRDSGRVQISVMSGICLSLDIHDAFAAVARLVFQTLVSGAYAL